MLLLMMMIVTFKMLKFSSLFLQSHHDSLTYNGIMQLYQVNSICFPKNVPVNIIATLVVDQHFQRLFMMFVLKQGISLKFGFAGGGGGRWGSQHISKVLQPYQLKGHQTNFLVGT